MQDPTPLKQAGSKEREILALAWKIAYAEATLRAEVFSLGQGTSVDPESALLYVEHVTNLLTQLLEAHDLPTFIED
jgi:hypothetical protein